MEPLHDAHNRTKNVVAELPHHFVKIKTFKKKKESEAAVKISLYGKNAK